LFVCSSHNNGRSACWLQNFFIFKESMGVIFLISSSSSMLSCDYCWIFSTKKFSKRRFDFASISFDST
jgi:uncharacterized Fe-S cluster-containing radical SAM superfamily protein